MLVSLFNDPLLAIISYGDKIKFVLSSTEKRGAENNGGCWKWLDIAIVGGLEYLEAGKIGECLEDFEIVVFLS